MWKKIGDQVGTSSSEDSIVKLLPVYDNLQRALAQKCSDEAFYKGVEMTMNQLRELLGTMGVTEIAAVGEKFDPATTMRCYRWNQPITKRE